MYKHGGHHTISQRRLSPSPSLSPSLSSSSALSSNPQPLHADGQHGHIGPSSDPQQHIRGQLGHMQTESPLVPPSLVQHLNDEGNIGEENSRFMIRPYGDSFTVDTYVVRQLNKIVDNFWRGPYITYNSAPKEVKDLWWNEFRLKFMWDETEEDEVKRIFEKKTGDHIRIVMNKAKTSQVKPDFIIGDNWTKIKRTWETEKNKQISEQNKKNRTSNSSEGSATYDGGFINIEKHKKRMADELGRELTYTDTFERTLKKKDKTWTDDQVRVIKEKYDGLFMSNASGGDGVAMSEQSVNNRALWVKASGGIKRRKIFGMGSLSKVCTTNAVATSSSIVAGSKKTQHEEQMAQELSQLKHLLAEKDEKIRVLQQKMQLILRHLNLYHDEVPLVPPTNPIGDEHNDDEIAADDDYVSSC